MMNEQLRDFARMTLKDGLAKLEPKHHVIFKRMYARNNGERSIEDALAMDINDVVDEIPDEKLDHAMQQVQRSLERHVEHGEDGNDG